MIDGSGLSALGSLVVAVFAFAVGTGLLSESADLLGGESVSEDSESASLIVVVLVFAVVDAFASSGDSKVWIDGDCVSISVSGASDLIETESVSDDSVFVS